MDEKISIKENKMGIMPIDKLLISMSIPMIISMLIQAMYNIIDGIFVSNISENAFTSVSLAFPVQNLMIAVAVGTAVGINALLSKNLGAKNYEEANATANNGLFLTALSYMAFAIFGIFFARLFFKMQTDISEIVDYGTTYIRICTIMSFGIFGEITCERLLQSTGKTIYTMVTQGIGAIINIILDPILIFGLLGFPKLGVAGAALATVIGQIIAFGLSIYFNFKRNSDIKITLKKFKPSGKTIKEIYSVGLPSIIMQSISSIMIFGFNRILLTFSSTATAVLGAYFKLQSFVFMPIFGLNNGMVSIIAYNYGAKNKERILKTIKHSIGYAMGIMLLGFIIFQVIPDKLLGMFNASPNMISTGIPALRIISLSFLFAGYCIVVSSVFQSLGNGFLSLFTSVTRQLIVLLPVAFIFSKTLGLKAVWFSFPIAEIASVSLSTILLIYVYKKEIKPLS